MSQTSKWGVSIAVVLIVASIGMARLIVHNNTPAANKPTPSVAGVETVAPSGPAIPKSGSAAMQYIDQASTAVAKGDYQHAVDILSEGINQIPDDKNLRLTREYYTLEALRNGINIK